MHRWVIRTVQVAAFAVGGLLITGTAAQADTGVGNGNQLATSVQAPITISGNALSIGGFASAKGSSGGGAAAKSSGSVPTWSAAGRTWSAAGRTWSASGRTWSAGSAGILNANQLSLQLHAPITVSGNAVSLGGFASAGD